MLISQFLQIKHVKICLLIGLLFASADMSAATNDSAKKRPQSAQTSAHSKAQKSAKKNTKKTHNQNSAKPRVDAVKPKESLSKIHDRIEQLKQDLGKTEEAHADVADALKKSEKAISETNRKLYEIKQDHQKYSAALASLEQEKLQLTATIDEQKKQLSKQIYQQYIRGEAHYLPLILDAKNPNDIAREMQYLSYLGRARHQAMTSIQNNLTKVNVLNDKTAETLKQVEGVKREQEIARQHLEKEKENKAKVLETLASKINTQRNEIAKLKRDERNLSDLVMRIAKAEQAKAARKQSSKPQQSETSATQSTQQEIPSKKPITIAKNDALPSASFDGANFASQRGKLNLPVRGEISNRFGTSREDTGVTWKGLFIRATEGSEVKSIASGKIVFADWMRGFGNLLIIDHGDGYMSLYGNNQALLRKVGETVKGGDTIASVGNTGGNETSGLYYELRKQSKPLDPMAWSIAH
jgi:septal ring factor EnvC (AmiA/AmiB activator)